MLNLLKVFTLSMALISLWFPSCSLVVEKYHNVSVALVDNCNERQTNTMLNPAILKATMYIVRIRAFNSNNKRCVYNVFFINNGGKKYM